MKLWKYNFKPRSALFFIIIAYDTGYSKSIEIQQRRNEQLILEDYRERASERLSSCMC